MKKIVCKNKSCGNCYYFYDDGDKVGKGKCKINPPIYDEYKRDCFPKITVTSWCGKFRPKSKVGFDGE